MLPLATLADIKDRIALRGVELRPSAARFLQFALENPHMIAFGTLERAAIQAGVSANTVLAALRLFGLRDFRSLRDMFRDEIRNSALRRSK